MFEFAEIRLYCSTVDVWLARYRNVILTVGSQWLGKLDVGGSDVEREDDLDLIQTLYSDGGRKSETEKMPEAEDVVGWMRECRLHRFGKSTGGVKLEICRWTDVRVRVCVCVVCMIHYAVAVLSVIFQLYCSGSASSNFFISIGIHDDARCRKPSARAKTSFIGQVVISTDRSQENI